MSALLTPLVRLPGFRLQNRRTVVRALALYEETNLDFGDVMIVASMEQVHARQLYSYDKGFDRLQQIQRLEPES